MAQFNGKFDKTMFKKVIYLFVLITSMGLTACSNGNISEDIVAGPFKIPKQDVKLILREEDDGHCYVAAPIKFECVEDIKSDAEYIDFEMALCDEDGTEMALIVGDQSVDRFKKGAKVTINFSTTIGDGMKSKEEWEDIIARTKTISFINYSAGAF